MAVPDNYLFSLSCVRTELQVSGTTADSLSGVFTCAPNASYDSSYQGSENCLRNFRNYDLIVDYGNQVGTLPYSMAFDGINMWSANSNTCDVSIITPTGVVTTYGPTGKSPKSITFDGANMWTANSGSGTPSACTVTKITSGGTLTTYSLGTNSSPQGMTFDGTNMWTSNFINTVSKITPSGAVTKFTSVGSSLISIAFDTVNKNLWISDDGVPQMIKMTTGGTKTCYTLPSIVDNIIYVNGYIWGISTPSAPNKLIKVDVTDGTWTRYSGSTMGTCLSHLAYDGTYIWATHRVNPGCVSKFSTSGNLISRFVTGGCCPAPIAFNNVNGWMWYINYNTQLPAKIGAV